MRFESFFNPGCFIWMFLILYSIPLWGDAPVLSDIEKESIRYEKGSGERTITEKISIKDDDSRVLRAATITITEGYHPNEDRLRFKRPQGILSNWNESTGTLTFYGYGMVSTYEHILRSIKYENLNNLNPAEDTRIISFTVSDGSESNSVSRNIEMAAVAADKSPVLSGIETTTLNYCVSADNIGITQSITISDENDDQLNSAIIRIAQGYRGGADLLRFNNTNRITGNWDPNSGILELTGDASIEGYTEALRSIRFENADNETPTGTRNISFVVDDGRNESNSVSRNIQVASTPDVEITGLAHAYNKQSTTWVPLTGSPSGGEFSGPGVVYYETGWYLLPNMPSIGQHEIIYKYNADGCTAYDTATFEILDAVAFIEFDNDRKQYCHNEPPFGIHGINLLADEPGSFTISGGIGLTNLGNNRATINPSLLNPGVYTVTYSAPGTTPVSEEFEIGASIVADFSWDKACFQEGASVSFSDRTSSPFSSINTDGYHWKVHNGSSITEFHTAQIQYKFPAAGKYNVELIVENSLGCKDSILKVFPLSEIIALTENSYKEHFESGASNWNSGNEIQTTRNSWTLGDPAQGFTEPYSGTKAWYTKINPSSIPAEKSWVTSPCFDLSDADHLIISAQIWRLFASDKDGVSLQASVDNGKTWNPVGTISSGSNWYNDNYGNAQRPGWTNFSDASWIEARHTLDQLTGKSPVQFRFLYEAGGTATGNLGFAFDDFKIARSKNKSVMEYFTNSSSPLSLKADSTVDQFATKNSASVIDLQYHTSSPENDPFYMDNPTVPSTRQLYYGINLAPYALLNGGSQSNQQFDFVNETPVLSITQPLLDSKFDIQVYTMIERDILYVKVVVKALQDISGRDLALRIAVYEPVINTITGSNGDKSFRNVVKTMLPGAGGISFTEPWNQSDSVVIVESWEMKNVYTPGIIKAAAFIQDEDSHEIYQAATDTRGLFTGVDDPVEPVTGTLIYPNPANVSFTIDLRENHETASADLINNIGQIIRTIQINKGTNHMIIPVADLPAGVYLLRIREKGLQPEILKAVISR